MDKLPRESDDPRLKDPRRHPDSFRQAHESSNDRHGRIQKTEAKEKQTNKSGEQRRSEVTNRRTTRAKRDQESTWSHPAKRGEYRYDEC